MKKELIKIISLTSYVMISLMIIIYSSMNFNLNENKLDYILLCVGIVSQIVIIMIINVKFNNVIKKSIVTGLVICELIAAVICIISGNNLLGTSLIIIFFAISYIYPKVMRFIDIKKKKRNFYKIKKYIIDNYPNAEINEKDNDIKRFNGKSMRFYSYDETQGNPYIVFIDSHGNITDMIKVFKENDIDVKQSEKRGSD